MSSKKDSLKPWLSRPAINRSVTLPLTRPLTQRLSNLNEFHPNELDPFLLFDARDSMIGTLENPTLDLDPSKPDTLNVITATRSGVATYTDVNGLIATASDDTVRVDYTQGAELTPTKFQRVGNTDFTSSLWVKNSSTLTFNQETAPDGTQTAAKYVGSGTAQDSYYNDTFTGPFTYSLFVKYINAPFIRLRNGSTSTWFDLTTVSVATKNHDSAAIKDVGDGWFRISVTVNSSSSFIRAYFYPHSTDNTTVEQDGGSFYLWGPQLEEGTTASSFVANTTGSPKFIASATYGPRVPMILVEPSATNLLTYSEDFSQWVEAGEIETTTNFTVSPDGTQNATKLELTGSSSGTDGKISFPVSTASQTHTFSVYAKKGSHNYIYIWMAITGGNITRWINLDDGSHSGSGTATLKTTEVGNDWWKIEYTFDATNLYNIRLEVAGNFISTGTGGDNVYIWGAQLETGSVSTSYIPTSGGDAAARTRAADDLVISGSAFDFYNQSEGTVYVEATPFAESHLWSINDGSSNNKIYSFFDSSVRTRHYVRAGGTSSFEYTASPSALGEISRSAFSFKTNDAISSVDGTSSPPDSSVTLPSGLNRLTIGQTEASGYTLNGHIKRLIYWPYHSDSL